MSFKAVLWDMDGTLVDSEPLSERAFREALEERSITPDEDFMDDLVGVAADDIHDALRERYGLKMPLEEWEGLKMRIQLSYLDEAAPFAQSIDTWWRLKEAGVPQAVVSNSDRMLVDAHLAHLRLTRAQLITVSRNDVRKGKPDPEPYLRAAHLLDVDPRDTIVVEDSPTGARAGIAAGMKTFLVPWSQSESDAERLSHIADILPHLGLSRDTLAKAS